jgi:Ala-tRNA(Pro) deacylase
VKAVEGFFIILVPGNRKIDFNKLPFKARLADPKDAFRITGCEIGSVHPFGNLFGLRVFMDIHVLDNEVVHFSAGTHNDSISMSPRTIAELIKPEIGDYTIEK